MSDEVDTHRTRPDPDVIAETRRRLARRIWTEARDAQRRQLDRDPYTELIDGPRDD